METTGAERDVGAVIREEIAHGGPIPFARFMALALSHPTLGYYAGGGAGREPLGWSGDYFTSGDISPLWGWALARQLREMWEALGSPSRFDVIEAGAGRGLLAREVWRFARFSAPEWGEALHYTLVDSVAAGLAPTLVHSPPAAGDIGLTPILDRTASSLFESRRATLASELECFEVPEGRVRWVGSLREAGGGSDQSGVDEDAAGDVRGITGVILSNELIDALPVHVVQAVGDDAPRLMELYVDVDARGLLVERLGEPSSWRIALYLDRYGVPWRSYGTNWRAEVSPTAEDWIRDAAASLHQGFLLTIDYGASARRLYTRDRRHGTLAVYSRHQFGDRPLVAPGQQDITAHVNFTALARAGREQGMAVAGYTTQGAFLRRLGVIEAARLLGQRLYSAAESERQSDRGQAALLRQRMLESAAATLIDPHGLGGFRVLVQQRGAPNARHMLTGLRRGR